MLLFFLILVFDAKVSSGHVYSCYRHARVFHPFRRGRVSTFPPKPQKTHQSSSPKNLIFLPKRLEKQMEQEEQAYQQQRRRLYSDLQDEKERMAAQAQRQRQEMDETVAELQVS